jgi:MFS family permease
MGPQIGNIYAGFIAQQLGWRWVFYLTSLLIMGVHWFVLYFTLTETRHNFILERKAARLRKETGDETYVSVDEDERKTMPQLLRTSLTRPFIFLFTEPITMFAAMWNGLLYGLIFLFNDAFSFVFGPGDGYNWQHPGVVQLTFLAFVVGETIGFLIYPFTQEKYYQRAIKKAGQSVPEARMVSGTFGCCLLPIGLFMFAWTCDRSIPFIVPLIGAAIFGIGFFQVLYGIMSWTVDSYQEFSASALGATILVRNLFGAAFPLIGNPMYHNLGRHWASSLIAFLALPLIP